MRISGLAGFMGIDEAFELSPPANWRELTSAEMTKPVDLMKEEGLNLAWRRSPRSSVS